MKKIIIDKGKCIGCHKCKHVCYSVFDIDSDGKACVRFGISEGDILDAERAVIECPTGAIKIIDINSNIKSIFSNINSFKMIFIILIAFYAILALELGLDKFKGDNYISSTKYNEYITNIAENLYNKDIFEFEGKPINGADDNYVTLVYTFKNPMSKSEYEDYAYRELVNVYNSVKDVKIKKDKLVAPKGKDLVFSFYVSENGQKKEIGLATIYYMFGSLNADDYIEKKDDIIFYYIT